MLHDTRTGLEISGNRSFRIMNPPQTWIATLLKQFILTENGTKDIQHPKKSFGMSFKRLAELFLKTIHRKLHQNLSKRVQTALKR